MNGIINMPYIIFKAGEKEYKLKLSAYASMLLEKKLGCSIFQGFKRISEIGVAVDFLYTALLKYQSDIIENDVFGIYDDFVESGGTLEDFAGIIAEVMTVSGFLKQKPAPD